MNKCETCGVDLDRTNSPFGWGRCYDHWICDDCGTKEKLCKYSEGLLCDDCHEKRVSIRIKKFKGSTFDTDEITCPWCGFEYSDSWERSIDVEVEEECEDCGGKFVIDKNVSVTYSTKRMTEPSKIKVA